MRSLLLLLLISTVMTSLPTDGQGQPASRALPPVEAATMQTLSFRLRPGQDLKEALDALVTQYRIGAGAVLTCVGSLTDVSLRLANQDKATHWHGHFEIVSLTGTLATAGSHLHLSVSDSTGRTLGGHLMAGCRIYTTAELLIGVLPELDYMREPDPTYGYRELVIKRRKKK
ncbi:DNA-binding protein [Spirosoma luteolum]